MKAAIRSRVLSAKQEMEHQVAKLYEEFHACKNAEKREEIKRKLDEMIASLEAKKESTKIRLKQETKTLEDHPSTKILKPS